MKKESEKWQNEKQKHLLLILQYCIRENLLNCHSVD